MPQSLSRRARLIPRGLVSVATAACLFMGCAPSASSAPTSDAGADVADVDLADRRPDAGVVKITNVLRSKLSECVLTGEAVPETVLDVVDLINRLPAPASIPCLVASLPRPLRVVASSSISSLQPAGGAKSPRLIIMYEHLLLTVVATGEGAGALELGEWTTPRKTLKAELHFPVDPPVANELPFAGLVTEGSSRTSCAFCHADEQPHPDIPGAFVSTALRPFRAYDVSVESVRALRESCDVPGGAGPQCMMLVALFDFGAVQQGIFTEDVMEGF